MTEEKRKTSIGIREPAHTPIPPKKHARDMLNVCVLNTVEAFRFEDKNTNEYEIWFNVFSRIIKK